jgi:hypothetical protein
MCPIANKEKGAKAELVWLTGHRHPADRATAPWLVPTSVR